MTGKNRYCLVVYDRCLIISLGVCNVNYGINDTGYTHKKIGKHNQKLISILENQKIYGGFLKNTDILGFTFQNPFTKVLLCK